MSRSYAIALAVLAAMALGVVAHAQQPAAPPFATSEVEYVIYSYHHFDDIAGGKPFKDAGATFVAHRRAQERRARVQDSHTVLPDETVNATRTITLGDTSLRRYCGLWRRGT